MTKNICSAIFTTTIAAALLTGGLLAMPAAATAAAKAGEAAPAFDEKDAAGKTQKLADYKGKWLVLEWYNKDCPYVKKHYGAGNMQKIQKAAMTDNVAWLQVISSAKGKQGYLEPAEAIKVAKDSSATPTATLIDADGNMGKAYGAVTTPHMFVINPEGKITYAGAIDNNDSSDPATIAKSTNYVVAALDAGKQNKAPAVATAKPYGCSVKY